MFAKVQNGTILRVHSRPTWRYPQTHEVHPGEVITDDSIYRAGGLDPAPDAAGWFEISDESKPPHDPATKHPPQPKPQSEWVIETDRVVKTWHAPEAKALDEVLSDRISSVNRQYQAVLNGGFEYDFGTSKNATLENGATEPAGTRTLQTRSADRERWQATMQVAQQYVVAGMPTEPMRPFRTADNARVPMTAQDVADCLSAMQAKFGLALDAMWSHKDALRQRTTVADVIAYDATTLWPT